MCLSFFLLKFFFSFSHPKIIFLKKTQHKTTTTMMTFNNKTTGALRSYSLSPDKQTEIQRILNLMASSNLSKLLQSLEENTTTTTSLTTTKATNDDDIITNDGDANDIKVLMTRNTYALAMSGEM